MIERERLTELNNAPEQPGDYVLYWMQNSQRAEFNPALEMAIAGANRLGLPVIVGFGLTADYPEANARHYAFMLEGLAETARALRQRGLGFAIRFGNLDDVALSLAKRARSSSAIAATSVRSGSGTRVSRPKLGAACCRSKATSSFRSSWSRPSPRSVRGHCAPNCCGCATNSCARFAVRT